MKSLFETPETARFTLSIIMLLGAIVTATLWASAINDARKSNRK